MTAPSELVDMIAGVLEENGITDPEYRTHVAQAVADALVAEGTVTTETGLLADLTIRRETVTWTTPWREVES